MEVIRLLLLFIAITSGILLIAGLISPWLVLWWMDYQNRIRVIRIYGSIFLVALLIYYLTGYPDVP